MLRGEFEKLLTMLKPEGGVDKGDLAKIKEQVFGPSVFWVTETRLTDDLIEGGWLVRAAPALHAVGCERRLLRTSRADASSDCKELEACESMHEARHGALQGFTSQSSCEHTARLAHAVSMQPTTV
jgi:hypothetical protein